MGKMKKRNLIIVFIVAAVCAVIIYSVVVNMPPMIKMQDVVRKSYVARKPIVFLIYPAKEKSIWDTLRNDQQLTDLFDKVHVYTQPVSFFEDSKWKEKVHGLNEPALLAVDYRNNLITMHEGLPDIDQLRDMFKEVFAYHDEMIAYDAIAKKELETVQKIIEEQRYVDAMQRLRTYLMVYENTELEAQARGLLNQISTKPQVIEYLRVNRDTSNRKVLLYKAQEDVRYKRYFNAYRAITMLTQHFPKTEEAKEASKLKEQIDEIAREEFKEASVLYDNKKYYEAYEKYLSLHKKFQGTHWDVYISGKIQQIDADPEFAAYKENRAKDREMESIFNQAERLFEQENWDQAEQVYNTILRFYPKSRFAFPSKQRIKQMNTLRYSKPPEEHDNSTDAKEE